MPLLNVKISVPANQATTQQVANLLTNLTHQYLKKRREVTAVQVQYVPAHEWFIGGDALSLRDETSYSLDIKVTSGTNTKDEMKAYLQAVFDGMQNLFGRVAEASYAIVHEVRADSWGFGGPTQEARYINSGQKAL